MCARALQVCVFIFLGWLTKPCALQVLIPPLISLSHTQTHDEVRFLLYRLDFNEFNTRMRATSDDD